jgi:hypothetical protein
LKTGAWIHTHDDLPLAEQIEAAAQYGLTTIRCYHYQYAEAAAPALQKNRMSLLAGMHIDSEELIRDWRSQVRLDELARYHSLGIPLEGVCVGNELREGGDEPDKKRFSARLSFGLANVLAAYRAWLDEQGYSTLLTYAMEGIVFDAQGDFYEWLWPLVDVCDSIGVNLYPMGNAAWFTYDAFEESRRFLCEPRSQNDRLVQYEYQLRRLLAQMAPTGKPIILTETGFPSAVGYSIDGERLVIPQSDNAAFAKLMDAFTDIIARANADYDHLIQAIYFYEWRDNYYHDKIWNVEHSPIHTAFGLCDRWGAPKLDIARLVERLG